MESTNGSGVEESPQDAQSSSADTNSPHQTSEKPPTAAEIRAERKRLAREEKNKKRIAKQVMPFQSDAVELEYKKVAGGARWTLYIAILLLCATVAWAYWARIDKIVIASGELVPVDTPIVVQPVVSAPIKTIHVRLFDRVAPGQTLAILDPTFTDSDIAQLESDIRKSEAKILRLQAEIEEEPFVLPDDPSLDLQLEYQNYLARKSSYNAKMAEFEATISGLKLKDLNAKALEEKYTEMQSDYEEKEQRFSKLVATGAANQIQLEDVQLQLKSVAAEILKNQGQQKEMTAELASTKALIVSYEAELKRKAIEEYLVAKKELDKAKEALKKATYNKTKAKITAPTNTPHKEFYVIQIAERTAGSMVQAGEPLMRLMPINAELEAEVEIQGKDIGLLNVGDNLKVRVKLTTYEYQKYGTLDGIIRTISEGTVQKQGGDGKQSVSVYKARIKINFENSPDFTKPRNFNPLPGMTVITDIKVGDRRVIEYFLYPFLKHLDVAAREP